MEDQTVFDILIKSAASSFSIWILGLLSVISLGVAIERIWYFFIRTKGIDKDELKRKVVDALLKNNTAQAIALCESSNSTSANVFHTIIDNHGKDKTCLEETASRAIENEVLNMDKRLGILGTIGNIAPYVGLFGTVIGVMKSFQSIGTTGAAGPAIVMKGISEALIATAVGLFVAVLSVVFYNFFIRIVKHNTRELNLSSAEIVDILTRE